VNSIVGDEAVNEDSIIVAEPRRHHSCCLQGLIERGERCRLSRLKPRGQKLSAIDVMINFYYCRRQLQDFSTLVMPRYSGNWKLQLAAHLLMCGPVCAR
jgi:hypothetical protein